MPSPSERARLDPVTAQVEKTDSTLDDKIRDLHTVIKAARTAMLVTRNAEGNIHSRAMNPVNLSDESQLDLIFLANNVSGKFEEIEHDSHANVSFFDPSTTSWVSYAGKARVSRDSDLIHKYWSTFLTDYIGDLEDGIHKGDADDPRISAIEVVPDEIRYWFARTLQAAAGEALGKVTLQGELRTINKEEIRLTHSVHTK